MTIGETIKKIRIERGLTQKQLGELCGIDPGNLRKYESGKIKPKIETIKKIADALETTILDICDNDKLIVFDLHTINKIIDTSEAEKILRDSLPDKKNLYNISIGYKENDLTPEELEKVKEYIEFLKSKRP